MRVRRRQIRVIGAALLALSAGIGALSAFGVFASASNGNVNAAAALPPYGADPAATLGGVDFFDASGTQITTGSTTASPFVAYAVAQNAPVGGVKAAYFAYTPVNGSAPGTWGGAQLGGGTAYPVSAPTSLAGLANPMVTGKSGDVTLTSYTTTNPNTDTSADGYAGLYAIRVKVTGVAGYALTDIVISGSTWTQVDGSYTSPAKGGSGPATTTTTVSADPPSPIGAGTSVTFTATVSPTAPGNVQFMDGGTALGSAVPVSGATATFTTSTLPAGTHPITAVFTPTDSAAFGPSTSTALSYVVNATGAATTSTAIASNPGGPVTSGTSVIFTASVTPQTAPGSVQFMDGGDTLGSPVTVDGGTANLTTSSLSVATHSITAVFTSSTPSAFGSSTSLPLSFQVTAGTGTGATATTTTVVASPPSPTTAGTATTFTATVTPSAAGSVQFMDGTTALGSAVAVTTGTTSATASSAAVTLSTGSHPITAVFTPTTPTAFSASTSDSLSYVVNAAGAGPTATTTTLTTSAPSPTTAGTSVTFTATILPSSAAGSVQFMDGAATLGTPVTVSGGAATSAATTTLSTGTHSLTAVFTPINASLYAPSTSTEITYIVNAVGTPASTSTTLTSSVASPTTTGTSVTFTATLAPSTAVGTVQFMNGTTAMGSPLALSSGTATYTTSFGAAATYQITAVFTPSSATTYSASTSPEINYVVTGATVTSTALAISPATTAAAGASVQLTATVTPSSAVGSVTFYDGSTTLGTQTLSSGSGVLSTTALAVGSAHSFVAIFTPTNSTATDPTAFKGSQSPAVPYTITAADATTTTLTGPDGTPMSSNPTLTLGEVVTVQAAGFTPGETVSAVVHSTPETLTAATASSTGTLNYQFTVPSDLATGAHSLVLTGATSQTTVTISFSIASPEVLGTTTTSTTTPSAGSASLPFTGSDIELLAAFAMACTGAGIAMRSRKQSARYAGAHEWRRQH
jgi:hypothetical protein